MEHHRVEPGVETAQRLLQRVRLVQEQRDRHGRPARKLASERAEALDAPRLEPRLVPEQAARADDRRRALGLGGLDDSLQRVAVPRFEVAERVAARAGFREQRRQCGEGHGA